MADYEKRKDKIFTALFLIFVIIICIIVGSVMFEKNISLSYALIIAPMGLFLWPSGR
jgi:hypothetical protein